jgi:hypothetical protein
VSIRAGLLVAVLLLSAEVAVAARWAVDAHGNCVHEWTPSSIARGPLAMANGLTFPGRQLVGGGQAAQGEPSRSTGERILLVPMLALLGFGSGSIEGLFVMSVGMTDFLTGGAFDLVPDESADVSLAPMTPTFLAGLKQTPTTDPCGRPR